MIRVFVTDSMLFPVIEDTGNIEDYDKLRII